MTDETNEPGGTRSATASRRTDVTEPSAAKDPSGAAERSYTIREVATMFHMQPSTLRYYEEQGLLTGVGRTGTGQREYRQCHVNRLRTICCFKHAGMSIGELKRFFSFESDEEGHIDEIMTLLEARRTAIEEQERLIAEAHAHILRKLHYYGDIRSAAAAGDPRPDWADYRHATFKE